MSWWKERRLVWLFIGKMRRVREEHVHGTCDRMFVTFFTMHGFEVIIWYTSYVKLCVRHSTGGRFILFMFCLLKIIMYIHHTTYKQNENLCCIYVYMWNHICSLNQVDQFFVAGWSTDTGHDMYTDTSTRIIIWKIDIIKCNHKCRCRVGAGHRHVSDTGHD
jgi:hypothetical protein